MCLMGSNGIPDLWPNYTGTTTNTVGTLSAAESKHRYMASQSWVVGIGGCMLIPPNIPNNLKSSYLSSWCCKKCFPAR